MLGLRSCALAFPEFQQVGPALQLWGAGFSLRWLLSLQSMALGSVDSGVAPPGLWSTGSVVVAHE